MRWTPRPHPCTGNPEIRVSVDTSDHQIERRCRIPSRHLSAVPGYPRTSGIDVSSGPSSSHQSMYIPGILVYTRYIHGVDML